MLSTSIDVNHDWRD